MPERIYGFAPVWRSDARLLILGSMPSVASLEQQFYYAHPRNCFWPMLAQILGEALPADVAGKKSMLLRHRIALWDTAASCEREGSLDSAMRQVRANNFELLYQNCPEIRHLLFNGTAAYQLYCRLVSREERRFTLWRLPSTSPAYTMKYEEKRTAWARALKEALKDEPL